MSKREVISCLRLACVASTCSRIAGESISGWIPSWKTGDIRPTRQPFCSQMEERLLEHAELKRTVSLLQEDHAPTLPLPSYDQVRASVRTLNQEPKVREEREQLPRPQRDRQSPRSFALSIPAPAQLTQVDEHSMELSVITPDGIPVTRRVHAAVLVCVKTAAIMRAVLALGSLREEEYMRLIKGALEPKDRLVPQANCSHLWPCSGKPAVVFHDRGKIFPSERARHVLVDRLGIITEQAPPYCPSAKASAYGCAGSTNVCQSLACYVR